MAITTAEMDSDPQAKELWFTESLGRGFGAFLGRVTPSGERRFYFRYTDPEGRQHRRLIGAYGAGGLTVAQARVKARELSALYQSGVRDLRAHFEALAATEAAALEAQRLAAEAEARQLEEDARAAELVASRRLTVRQLFLRWQATDLQPHIGTDGKRLGRKDGGAFVAAQFERHVFPTIGDQAAADLTRQDLLAILDARKAAGTLRTANMLLTDLRQMLAFAVERAIIPTNPLQGIQRRKIGGKDTERERVLSDAELRQLWAALPAARLNPRSRCALGLILATGVRVGEATGATWADAHTDRDRTALLRAVAESAETKFGIVDMAARTWHLPDTKNQREHTIHLSDFALTQLQELAQLRELDEKGEPSPWLFPDRSRVQPVCVKSLGKQIADRQRPADKRMKHRAKGTEALRLDAGPWTLHDLRRTAATILARLGFSTDVIDECLNHMLQSKVARIYIRDRREADQRRAFDALGAHLDATLCNDVSAPINVLQLHRVA
ncbi:tyrosine-type recombinase/integrase [Inhella sp.]|uniref:tyrosine-type recombinase/integrase n=1 Tax=Inhella sp. TaxID=1921806 RepID=UPI0035B49AD5